MMKKIKARSLLMAGLLTLLFLTATLRLYWVQNVEADEILQRAKALWSAERSLPANRGMILDREDRPLAYEGRAYTVAVHPRLIVEYGNADEVVQALSEILGRSSTRLYQDVLKQMEDGRYFGQVELRPEGWKIDSDMAKLIAELQLPGVSLIQERHRYYPLNRMASHILGYYDKADQAIGGIESYYDHHLRGTSGKLTYEKDALGYELPNSNVTFVPVEHGHDLRLTLDAGIQYYLEDAMDELMVNFNPKSATAVILDPQTLEILAISSRPDFDPNVYWDPASQNGFFNHAIGSQYEPGSTFKIITLAGAVEEELFKSGDLYQSGQIMIPGATIRDHNPLGWGKITYLEGLLRSSNVAFVKLGYEELGAERFRRYIDQFGFNSPTGIDLRGESRGNIHFTDNPSETAAASFGQGITVTLLQQAVAAAAVANGGILMQPYLLKEVLDASTGEVLEAHHPKEIRRVISQETAAKVTELLAKTITEPFGTGRRAAIEGYRVAGKTGTAQKVIDGIYATDKWVVSFVGFAPLDNPRLLMAIIVDDPDIEGDYMRAGEVAAPLFQEVISKSLRYLGVPSDQRGAASEVQNARIVVVPDLIGTSLSNAVRRLNTMGAEFEVFGEGSRIQLQFPVAAAEVTPQQRHYLLTEPAIRIELPDMFSRSLREAMEICSVLSVRCTVEGSGFVIDQTKQDDRRYRLVLQDRKPTKRPPAINSTEDQREEDEIEQQPDDSTSLPVAVGPPP